MGSLGKLWRYRVVVIGSEIGMENAIPSFFNGNGQRNRVCLRTNKTDGASKANGLRNAVGRRWWWVEWGVSRERWIRSYHES